MTKLEDRARRLAEAKKLADEASESAQGMIAGFDKAYGAKKRGSFPRPVLAEALASIALSLSVIAEVLTKGEDRG